MNDGLIGAVKGARLPRLDPLKCIVALVAASGMVLIARKAGFSYPWMNPSVVLLLGLAALLGEFYFSGEVIRSWFERSATSVFMFALLWSCAFAFSVNQWIGSASDGQFEKAGAQKAAFVQAQQDESREAELTKKNNDLQQKITMAPQRGADAAEAAIKRAKGDRLWETTKGCTEEIQGKRTRQFCDGYASAVSDLEYGKNILVWREEQKATANELKEVRERRAAQGTIAVTGERTDLFIYTKIGGMTQETAMYAQASFTIFFVSFVMSGLGILEAARRYRGQPRRPWPFMVSLRRMIFGGKAPEQPDPTHTPVGELVGNRNPTAQSASPSHGNMSLTRVTVGDINREKLRRILDGNAIAA